MTPCTTAQSHCREVVGVGAVDEGAGRDHAHDRPREQVARDPARREVVGVGRELRNRTAEHHVVEVRVLERRVAVHAALLQEVEERVRCLFDRRACRASSRAKPSRYIARAMPSFPPNSV